MDNTADIILLAVGVLIGLLLFVLLLRWVFAVKRHLWNQQQQITLLSRIAEKLGVSKEETETIEEKNNRPI